MALQEFLNRLGVSSEWVRSSKPAESRPDFFHKAPCFESAGKYELLSGGEKIIASAQRRFGSGLLQHGTIKLSGTVAHPALDRAIGPVSASKAIEKEQLAEFGLCFGEAMSEMCRVKLRSAELTSDEVTDLINYSHMVKEYRLERRLNIEQTCASLGLS